ncbi:MAG: NlpC/P60 family protein [Oscillospiraceae bacterium]
MLHFWKTARRALLLTLLLTALFTVTAFAGTQATAVGTVTASKLRMRASDSTSSSIVTEVAKNSVVSVLGKKGGWYQVAYGGKTGYMSAQYLTVQSMADKLSTYGCVTGDVVNVRSGAGTLYGKVTTAKKGGYVTVSAFKDGWYQISFGGKTGWIRSDYLDLYASLPSVSVPAGSATRNGSTYTISATINDVLEYAKGFIGTPYVYGGASSKGFDCSGFTMYIFSHFGISLPHSATSQLNYGLEVSRANLMPGDLVFFRDTNYSTKAASHVGIYLGNGNFIHASSSVSGKRVTIDSLNSAYHSSVFTVGRRIIAA